MNPKEPGVVVVREGDGVWRQRAADTEIAEPQELLEEGEEDLVLSFFGTAQPAQANDQLAFLDATARPVPDSSSDDEQPLSTWELELTLREATIEGLERKIAKAEACFRVLHNGKVVVRGASTRIAQLRAEIARLKTDLEKERALNAEPPAPKVAKVPIERLRVFDGAYRARGPRDPNKVQ